MHYLNQITVKDERNLKALIMLGKIYFNLGNYLKAEKYFKRVLEIDESEIDSRLLLAESLFMQEKYKEVIKLVEDLPKSKKGRNFLLFEGKSYLKIDSFEEAENIFTALLGDGKDNPEILTELGISLFKQNKLKKAIEVLKKSLVLTVRIKTPCFIWVFFIPKKINYLMLKLS
ncbi:MAG: tetratricopeptide repeat protein [Actinomycetota bacterium]